MIIHDSMEFHNIAGIEDMPGMNGVLLPRYPEAVRRQMNGGAIMLTRHSSGAEIRFVTGSKKPVVHLMPLQNDANVYVYQGDFLLSSHVLPAGRVGTIVRQRMQEEEDRLRKVQEAHGKTLGFHTNVCRIVMGNAPMLYLGCEMDEPVRPPGPEELPRLKWLAYGSSITHADHNGYVHQAARRLRVDLMNKGLSGSCHAEQAAADFFANDCEWDLMTMELGINMRGAFTVEAFRERVTPFISTLANAHPGKPIVVMDVFLNGADWTPGNMQDIQNGYRRVLDEAVAAINQPSLVRVPAADILTDAAGLSADMVHPTVYGHASMGDNLARILEPICNDLKSRSQ